MQAKAGLSASLWCVVIGVCVRSSGFVLTKGVFSGEFFVKIGEPESEPESESESESGCFIFLAMTF